MGSNVLQVRVPAELGERFRAEARARGVSMGFLLQVLLDGEDGGAQAGAGPELDRRLRDLESRLIAIEQAPRQVTRPNRVKSPRRPAQARRAVRPKATKPEANEDGTVFTAGLRPGSRVVRISQEQATRLESLPDGLPRTGDECVAFRSSIGMGRKSFSDALGIHRATYQKWEKSPQLGGRQLLALLDWWEAEGR